MVNSLFNVPPASSSLHRSRRSGGLGAGWRFSISSRTIWRTFFLLVLADIEVEFVVHLEDHFAFQAFFSKRL